MVLLLIRNKNKNGTFTFPPITAGTEST